MVDEELANLMVERLAGKGGILFSRYCCCGITDENRATKPYKKQKTPNKNQTTETDESNRKPNPNINC